MAALKNLVWFSEVDKDDIPIVGGKAANLGEMVKAGFPVPNGFVVTAHAYFEFVKNNNLTAKVRHLLNHANFDKPESLIKVSESIKREIHEGEMSRELILQIYNYYKKLGGTLSDPLVAVRSSATAEDLPNASFAGQQETYLNVSGEATLIKKVKDCWASLFEARAIFYRNENKFDHFKVGIAVPVQKMVESDASGVMFTIDPLTNDKSKIIIEAIYGLGEMIVQGQITPDHYEVDKKDLKILLKRVASQKVKLEKKGDSNKEVSVSLLKREKQKISDNEIKELAELGKKLEKHYYFPQDIEWAIDAGHVYIVQTRPVTTIKERKITQEEVEDLGSPILHGEAASPGIATGHVVILSSAKEIGKVSTGDVLVTEQTNPDYVPAMKKAVAIVTDMGGRTSHAAIVSRELGIPAVVGTGNATKILRDNMVVTVHGIKGEVFKGAFTPTIGATLQTTTVEQHVKTATKVYVNLAEPELAEKEAARNVDGVGLLRAEFMMAGIGVHPKKMIKDGKSSEFIEKLSSQLMTFCDAFNPRPVVYRATDFKTNEYRNLDGGKEYEPEEPNPMLGYRGAYRYIHDPETFKLELEAIKRVRNKNGMKNLWLMLPFVRTVKELEDVKQILSGVGLHRSPTFKLWMMVEIPSNVILLDKFIEVGIDGVSVGTNDLTMLILGTDRDNSEVAKEFDERNEAVKWALEKIISTCHKYKITSSICGQSVSSYPEILENVVRSGITSVSVSPDVLESVRKHIAEIEKELVK